MNEFDKIVMIVLGGSALLAFVSTWFLMGYFV